jgi:type IV pilus assembly protein PilA
MQSQWKARSEPRSRGFTLIELLIVILILAILMAVALPLYLASISHSETTVCRSNMQSVANAEQAFRARDSQHQYTTTLAALPLDLGAIPICPRGGTYSVSISDGSATAGNGQTVPQGVLVVHCTEPAHGDFAPSIDSE